MALVKIVYVSTPDRRGPDLTRIGTVEDIHPDLARMMVNEGSAVWATEADVIADEAQSAPPQDDTEPADAGDSAADVEDSESE